MNIKELPCDKRAYLISQWIFSARDRAIMHSALIDGIHYEPLAEEFNLTPQQIKNIVKKGKEQLNNHIDS